MSLTKKIKNNTGSTKVYVGQEIEPAEYYTIQPEEDYFWRDDAILQTDIASEDAIVNNGVIDLNPEDGLGHLQARNAAYIKSVLVDDSNKGDAKYMRYDNIAKALKYVDPMVEMAFDAEGDLLCDDEGNAIIIEEDF